MTTFSLYLEIGKKKVFASAVDWPGWSRSGRDEQQAVQMLLAYAPRYAKVLSLEQIDFQPPEDLSQLEVIEQHPGTSTTDFGAPDIIPVVDSQSFDLQAFEFSISLLNACWLAFEHALLAAAGKELRKGPRGGGRDSDKITRHVIDADRAYLSRIAWSHKVDGNSDAADQIRDIRQATVKALKIAATEGLPKIGPRGGKIWPARYFVRRAAWHILDHAWEIEDRIQ